MLSSAEGHYVVFFVLFLFLRGMRKKGETKQTLRRSQASTSDLGSVRLSILVVFHHTGKLRIMTIQKLATICDRTLSFELESGAMD